MNITVQIQSKTHLVGVQSKDPATEGDGMGGVYSCLLQLCQPKTAVLLAHDLNLKLLLGGLRQQSFRNRLGCVRKWSVLSLQLFLFPSFCCFALFIKLYLFFNLTVVQTIKSY